MIIGRLKGLPLGVPFETFKGVESLAVNNFQGEYVWFFGINVRIFIFVMLIISLYEIIPYFSIFRIVLI